MSGARSLSDDMEGFGRDPPEAQKKKEDRERPVLYLNVTSGTFLNSWRLSSVARGACEHFIQNQDWVVTVRACEP